ncbi:MAG: response regulator [Spirochaetota bacterium]
MSKRNKKVRIYSALEVANICGVVNQTAINWIKNGYLKAFTTPGGQYRIYTEDLIDFLNSRGMKIPGRLLSERDEITTRSTILIVDDDRELNNLIMNYLKRKLTDHLVVQAFDGFEAGKLISEEKPGVVILDIDLPGIDGHKLCKKIKEDASLNNPLIISISGLDDPDEKERILKEGAVAFLPKPLDFEMLLEFIQKSGQK